jgi:hypothetical protein
MQHFVTFKKYTDAALARETQQLLQDNGIISRLADNGASLDSSFGATITEYEVQLDPADFERADALLQLQAVKWIDDLPQDYYLFSFTDDELHEVIYKKDEWSDLDYVLARELLAQRGMPIGEAYEQSLREARLAELAQPEEAGYTGGISVISAHAIHIQKKTLPDGRTVHTYTKKDREKAYNELIIGIISIILGFLYFVWRWFH